MEMETKVKTSITLTSEQLTKAAEILKTIAHPVRLSIIESLHEKSELTVTELQEITALEQSSLSHHLIKMKDKGVLVSRREGKNIFYQLKDTQITKIFECMGNCQLLL